MKRENIQQKKQKTSNEAFVNRDHAMFETAMILKSSKAFENLSIFLLSIPPSEQFNTLAKNEDLLKTIRKELYLLIQTDTLNFDDLRNLGLEVRVIEQMQIELSELLQSSSESVVEREKRKAEMHFDFNGIDREKIAKLDSAKSGINFKSNHVEEESFIFELTDGEEDKVVSIDLGMSVNQFIKQLHISNIEQQILNTSTEINAKKILIESLSTSSTYKQEQIRVLSKEKALLEDRKSISSARIFKYTEMIAAYRQKITQILSQISDLEKARLQLQANMERSDIEARDCIASREADENKIFDLEKKLADLASSIDSEKNDIINAQNHLKTAENNVTKLRMFLDLKFSDQSIMKMEDVLSIKYATSAPNVNIAFFNDYSPKFYQIASDLFFHNVWKLPFIDRWKERVLKFTRAAKNSMIMCNQETLKGECKNDKCFDLHFGDLKISDEQFALQYTLKYLDPSEKFIMKDQLNLISTSSVDEYLSSFLQIPVVKSRLQKLMDISQSSIKESNKSKKKHHFITPILCDWSKGELNERIYGLGNCDIERWIKKSISALPRDTPTLPSNLLKESVIISLEGLQLNSKSEKFRSFFLDLLMAFTGDVDIIRGMFQSAIEDIPNSLHIKWMFYIFEDDIDVKKKICTELINSAITMESSLILFNCLIHFFFKSCQIEKERMKDCILIMQGNAAELVNLPFSGKLLRNALELPHFSILILIFIQFQVLSYFPSDLEMLPPHHNLTIPKLFLIPWRIISKPPSETILLCDEILQTALNYLQFCSKEEEQQFHLPFLAIVRNRIDMLQEWLNVKPSEIAGILNIYISEHPFNELLDLKAKYLWKAGSFPEANAVIRNMDCINSLDLELQIELAKGGLKSISDFIHVPGNSKRIESVITNPYLFSAHIEIFLSFLKHGNDCLDLKAKEIVLKELLLQKNSATKGFLWYLLIYIQVFLNKYEENDLVYTARKLLEESICTHSYPFKSHNCDVAINNPKSIEIHYNFFIELSSGLSLDHLEVFEKIFSDIGLNFPIKD